MNNFNNDHKIYPECKIDNRQTRDSYSATIKELRFFIILIRFKSIMAIYTGALGLVLCFLVVSNAYVPYLTPIRFRNIVIFGDSTSDTRNVFELTKGKYPIPPDYWNGRYSNGPNWVDQLQLFGISNYAYGSATTDNNLVQGLAAANTVPVPGMRQQIQIYLSRNPVNKIDFARTLYVFYGGPNDFIFNASLLPPTIMNSLLNGVRDLLALGAKNILVFNQPPVQKFPYTRPFNSEALFTQVITVANTVLTASLKQIQANSSAASLNMFDLNALVTKWVTKPTTYFTNVSDRCWTIRNITTVEKFCPDPDRYVFIDDFHFTTRAQGLLAEAVRPFLDAAYEVNTGNCYVKAVRDLP